MNNLDQQKEQARDMKDIFEYAKNSLNCTTDWNKRNKLMPIVEKLINEYKDEIREIASKQLEDEFLVSNK